jgi:pyruvate-formate lyase
MKERIQKIYDDILGRKHLKYRQNLTADLATMFCKQHLSPIQRATQRLIWVLEHEIPVVLPAEKIVFLRTIVNIPEIFTAKEWKEIKSAHYIHEWGRICNICPDYEETIKKGLEEKRKETQQYLVTSQTRQDREGEEFLHAIISVINVVESFSDRYADEAERMGNHEVAEILRRVPRYGAQTFHEALQFFRILHYVLWCSANYHNTVGRLDQYLYPYLKADFDTGRLDYDTAFELLEEFFISFNKDSDTYPGIQQGDNGQSIVLGGVDSKGNDAFNLLSEMCLKACLELKLIDPKINLRVHKDTKLEVFEMAALLTKQGLGFPQYSNDEIVIPGLVGKGYDLQDARNYVVAACWEFIIPKTGMDVPNIGALSFVKVVDRCIHRDLASVKDFPDFMAAVEREIRSEIADLTSGFKNLYMEPSPFISLLMDGCLKNARDISQGGKYNNYGLHGTGIATAVDSLSAIQKYVFETKELTSQELISAIDANFEGYTHILLKVKNNDLKMGNDKDVVDNIAVTLLKMFADALATLKNDRGGCYRPGTGSAMYYLSHGKEIGATADGRKKGEPLSANFSPSLQTKVNGPISIIKSFSKPDLTTVINGGPLTLELHDSIFRNPESINKVALLVKAYMNIGGHQLQLNAVNRETLIDAQKNPNLYPNLIVRVWGWSAYFVELDREYQDHIIQRVEFADIDGRS